MEAQVLEELEGVLEEHFEEQNFPSKVSSMLLHVTKQWR